MSYIQLEIGGKLRGLKFNQLAFQIYCQKAKWEIGAEASQVYAMFYGGLVGNCVAKDVEPDFTYEQVCDWVDELYLTDEGIESIKKVDTLITATQAYKKFLADVMDKLNEGKKKVSKAKRSNGT